MSSRPGPDGPAAGHVTVRYWASLRAAAGITQDVIPVSENVSLAQLQMTVLSIHGNSSHFGQLLGTCSVLVGDRPMNTGDPDLVMIPAGAVVEFLPPFAGG